MKKIIILFLLIFNILLYLNPAAIRFFGNIESTFDNTHERDYKNTDYGKYSWGLNNYSSLRIKADVNEFLTINISFNVNTFSGNYTDLYTLYYRQSAISSQIDPYSQNLIHKNYFAIPFYYKSTYVGSLDLERLYFTAGNKYFDIQAGLMRIAKGYGNLFSPMEIFNPKDPFNPNARPEGKVALIAAFYPLSMFKIETFAVLPDNPIEQEGWGFKFGTSAKLNINKINFEFIYVFFMPEIEYNKNPEDLFLPEYTNNDFSHLLGFSLKADIEIGLFFEFTYRFDHKVFKEKNYYGKELYLYRGLEASIGIDYTIPIGKTDMKFYFLIEYQFFGGGMLDFWEKDIGVLYVSYQWKHMDQYDRLTLVDDSKKPLNFLRHNYLYALIKLTINTYIALNINYLFGIDDQSSLLSWGIDIDPFQAFTINISGTYPLGWEIINNTWSPGEFGSTNASYNQKYKLTVKIKF